MLLKVLICDPNAGGMKFSNIQNSIAMYVGGNFPDFNVLEVHVVDIEIGKETMIYLMSYLKPNKKTQRMIKGIAKNLGIPEKNVISRVSVKN